MKRRAWAAAAAVALLLPGGCGDDASGPSPPGVIRCGDGVAAGSEECDGTDLRGRTCADLGFNSGALTCHPACVLDLRGCAVIELCANGRDDDRDGDKDCDDRDCAAASECAVCGDLRVWGAEECDDGNQAAGDCCTACRAEPHCEVEGKPTILDASRAGGFELGANIFPAGDRDEITLAIPGGFTATIAAETHALTPDASCAPTIDTLVEIGGSLTVVRDDDSGEGTCSRARAAGAAGLATVEVRASSFNPLATFGYRLTLEVGLQPCGDGVLQEGQECDDGNHTGGDGCSDACRLEPRAELEPNDVPGGAGPALAPPVVIAATIGPPQADNQDSDWFAVDLKAPGGLRAESLPGAEDCTLFHAAPSWHQEDGTLLVPSGPGSSPRSCGAAVARDLPAGRYLVHVAGRPAGPGYRLYITLEE